MDFPSRSAKASWIEIQVDCMEDYKAFCRGLRRPRGLKSSDYTLSPTGLCRGLRRPRGLKYNGQEKIRWWPLSRSAKASWIEIFIKSLIYFD